MKRPPCLVQIVLPTFSGARHIGESLSSLLGQSHREIAILVIDIASTDGMSDNVADVAWQDQRVTYCRNEHFACATENWVRGFDGIDLAASPYFIWASDDDVWDRDFVGKLVGELERDRRAVLAFP